VSDNPAARKQAHSLRDQARAGGLRFEAYLPGSLADWLLEHVEKGHFADPSEAVFVMVSLFRDLEPHQDLRDELLRQKLQAAMNDPRPTKTAEEVFNALERRYAEQLPPPARWRKGDR
jgi:Arc/MetJ-type ribon-helix-helix transcriptional regulator